MSRLAELRVVDPVLTTLARGYTNADFVGTTIAPVAVVDKEAGKIPQFGREAFRIYNTERAIRAKSNRMSPEGISTIDYILTEHDIEFPIDYREQEEAQGIINLEMYATETVMNIILLRLEKEIADRAQDLTTYPTGNKITLSGNAKWSATTTSNPISDINNAKEAIRGKIGRYPNVMLMGATAHNTLKNHPAIIERIKYSMKGIVTVDILKEVFDMPILAVGRAVYATSAGAFIDIWADNVILAYVPVALDGGERTPYAPSFAYTLRKRNKPEMDKYDEAGKLRIVRATDLLAVRVVGAEAGYIINDVV